MDLIDFSTLEELSQGDRNYFNEVIRIFIDTTSQSIERLKVLAGADDNTLEISGIAHSLKSGVGIIKIKGLLEELIQVEELAKSKETMQTAQTHLLNVFAIFEKARPLLELHVKKAS